MDEFVNWVCLLVGGFFLGRASVLYRWRKVDPEGFKAAHSGGPT